MVDDAACDSVLADGMVSEIKSGLQRHAFLRLQPNPLVDEVGVEAVAQRDIGNRGPRLGALLNDLGLERPGIGATLWLHERPS